MKNKILNLVVVAFVIAFSSCSDYLKVPSNSLLSDDQVYTSPDSAKKAIASIYEMFGINNSYRNRLWLQMALNTDIEYRSGWTSTGVLSSVKSDDYIALFNPNSNMPDGYSDNGASNPWSLLYQGIERANLAITGIRTYGKPVEGTDMGHFLGEALTLRAYFYYDLIKWWGDVPARFTPVNSKSIFVGKSNRDTIYNQIIKDLQVAIPLLYSPGQGLATTTKRISNDAARGLLARICLSAAGYSMRPDGTSAKRGIVSPDRQKELYAIARSACLDIINEGMYKLDPSFKNIFYQQCQDNESQGGETIWEIPYNFGIRGRMVYNLGLPRVADGILVTGSASSIGGQFKVMPSFFYDYKPNDTRRDITIVPYKVAKSTTVTNPIPMEQTLSAGIVGFNIAKWRAEWMKGPITGTDDGVSPIILRYADVLLMYAEADLFLGATDGAEKFNMVRRRAFNQPISVANPSVDLPLTLPNIQQERAFEFCGENIRKYDLERWGILGAAIDQARQNLTDLRNGAGNYADVPKTIYYKYSDPVDTAYNKANNLTPGERVLNIYGLNRGETDVKTSADGWVPKDWTQATTTSTPDGKPDFYLSDGFINNMYFKYPDTHYLLPIMHQIITTSNGLLSNDYGYDN